jgi:radical SAM protein with 4Fe4S-binding SPASM domain
MSDQELTSTIVSVERWLGNPLTRSLLRFMVAEDKCGNRLSNAIDTYSGTPHELCWKCDLAAWMVAKIMRRSSKLFGFDEQDIRNGLADPAYRRGMVNVLTGISRYGITRPQIVIAPFLVVWDFTHMCNLKCKHCYQDAQRAMEGELDTEEAKRVIEELAKAGVTVIAFSGGEPLMRKDFYEVAAHAHKNGIYVSLATNGTLITPEVAKNLVASGVDYTEISIDGKDAASHDSFRGIPGAFDRSMEGIRNCVEAGLYTCIATTVTQSNYSQIPDIYNLAGELGVKRMLCFNFIPTGRGKELVKTDLTPDQRESMLKFILGKDLNGGTPIVLSTAPQLARVALEMEDSCGVPVGHFHLGNEIQGKTRMLADFIGGCGAGRLYCSIEPTGNVQPCVFMPIKVGNIREKPFLDIWHQSEVLNTLRDRSGLKGSCGTCDYKLVCGGCRARAWAYYQDLNAPDPGCKNNQLYWDELNREAEPAPMMVPAPKLAIPRAR